METNGKFGKNEKLSFISDGTLILGCDVGSETHYMRAIDTRGRELSRAAFPFSNDLEGFQSAREWAVKIAAEYNKSQIVLGLEPTGHYWFCLATWMISNGISVVQVNPYAVKQTKEVEDNSQLKDDRKDPKLIANLVKDGNFGMPYLPEKLYGELRRLSMFRDQLNEDRIRTINRMHREMKIYFPEYKDALGKVDGAFSLELLKQAPFPDDLAALGEDGIRKIWHDARLRGRGYSRAGEILRYAKASVGIKDGAAAGRTAVKWFVQKILELDAELAVIEGQINQKCQEIPHAGNILEISGIGKNTLSGILAEMGDISRFDDVKEIQKLSGLGLVACSSGKHKGETKISHRGRKRLRYWLFQAAKSAVAHAGEFKELHIYYTARADNPLKKMQSLIVIACKLLRIIYAILKKGTVYDPKKMLMDIRRPEKKEAAAA
ncbi:MAG: IS110 family transposase [Lachnospiraceae bacterium]|nr:IS110 family transposase [Lachnospiraceae bacterium]